MPRLIRSICAWWELRTARRKLYRALPVLRELDRREAEYRRSHKRGSARIAKARRDAICAALAGKAAR
jgi:hypothetical protein